MSLRITLVACALVSIPIAAFADDKAECIAASEEGQTLATERHFVAARAKFVACANERCPGPVIRDCTQQLERVDASIATVVLRAEEGGAPLRDVEATIDGVSVGTLDGRAIPQDPGAHRFVLRHKDGRTRTLDVTLEEGAKLKNIVATFEPIESPVPLPQKKIETAERVEPPPRISALAWIVGGIGVAALGVGTALGVDVVSSKDHLYMQSDLDAFQIKEHVVDIAIGVGAVAIGVAVVLMIVRPRALSPRTASLRF